MQGKKLYVGNLTYSVTEDQMKELFAPHGTIEDLVIIKDKYTGRSKGFGFVEFSNSEEAQNAMEKLNGTEHEGRTIKVNEAHQKKPNNRNRGGGYNNR